MIKHILGQNSNFKTLLSAIDIHKKVSVINCGEGEVIGILDEINRPKLFVVPNIDEAERYRERYADMGYRVKVCTTIPELFLNAYSPAQYNYLEFVKNLANDNYDIHIATPNVVMLPIPNNILGASNNLCLQLDSVMSMDEVQRALVHFGYGKVDAISKGGEFSVRGEILDIVPMDGDEGYRVIFDYDTISKIMRLDAEYIQGVENIADLIISTSTYLEPDISKIKFGKNDAVLKQSYDNYMEFNKNYNCLWFLQFNKTPLVSLYDLLSDDIVIVYSDVKQVYDSALSYIEEYQEKIVDGKKNNLLLSSHINPLCIDQLTHIENKAVIGFQYINNANRIFIPNAVFSFKCMPNIVYQENYESLIIDLQNYNKMNYTTLLYLTEDNYEVAFNRIVNRVICNQCKTIFDIQRGVVNVFRKEYNNSYNFYDEKIAVIGSNAVGKVYKTMRADQSKLSSMVELELPKENDYVVHKIHGIGKCLGIQTLKLTKDVQKDYIVVEYKNEDKLYLPIENVDSITKYIGDTETPTLNKLGGVEFRKVKDKVKASVKDIAKDLITIYKARQEAKGYVYPEDDDIQAEFEKSFPHELTLDQELAINEIKQEMTSGKLIDRLVCGDVGFGKTEVALRIAFKTILASKQVAILCPTTILSEQHYNTCHSRMANFGVNVAVLNRFKTPVEVQRIITDFNAGKINIIVGTHKLLNSKIDFSKLGLLVIDEEQKFGVEHKEKIKKVKSGVNVITLSATPIPRTLHLSLSGIRDISTIQTPPTTKISTQVSVTELNDSTIKLAVEREMERSGQVLIIYNRVETIDAVAQNIRSMFDNKYTIDVAHGQMPANILEDKIINVYNGKTQILVSTTLIENGVDLPNANTLIILEADKLGLSQLYQLKGRVGRGSRESYAYFMYKGILSDIAYKRLKAISEFTAMGSGFKISMRDMELRGAGNIFGSQQSGHMIKIGYAMYMSILTTAIEELKTNSVNNELYQEIKIDTDIPTTIPQNSKLTTNQKMALYSRIAQISSTTQLEDIEHKLEDIYGEIPYFLSNLCKFSLIKNRLYRLGGTKLVIRNNDCYIEFDQKANLDNISQLVDSHCKLDISKAIRLNIVGLDKSTVLDYIISLLG